MSPEEILMEFRTTGKSVKGKCKELAEELIRKSKKPLVLVRGFYHCPFWGKRPHWWTKDEDGNIIDQSSFQFPTNGVCAEYEEFDGIIECEQCGKKVLEEDARIEGSYAFCSTKCLLKCVGL